MPIEEHSEPIYLPRMSRNRAVSEIEAKKVRIGMSRYARNELG